MKKWFAMLAVVAGVTLSVPQSAKAELIFGLASSSTGGPDFLVTFDSANPGAILSTTQITGAVTPLRGIDFRPSNGVLYGVGANNTLFTINTATGAATQLGMGFGLEPDTNPPVPRIGVDFNPVPDLLRIVSEEGDNLRVNPNTGDLVAIDADLTLTVNIPGVGMIQLATDIVSTAYTNPGVGTTQFDIGFIQGNPTTPTLFIQGLNPPGPNGGVLTIVPGGNNIPPISNLGITVDAGSAVGFDIVGANTAFASFIQGGNDNLFSINLATGTATLIGSINAPGLVVRDIAIALPAVPEPASIALLGVGAAGLVGYRRRKAVKA